MYVKLDDSIAFVKVAMLLFDSGWKVDAVLTGGKWDPVKVRIQGNQLLGRLLVMKEEGVKEI